MARSRPIFQHNFHGRIILRINIGKQCHRRGAIPANMSSRYGDNEEDEIGLDQRSTLVLVRSLVKIAAD